MSPDELFTRDEVLGGLPARRAATLLFLIESRGAHFRLDYPKRDDANWLKHTLAYKGTKAHDVRLEYKDVILIDDPIFKPKERKY